MPRTIPSPIISLLSSGLSDFETHATLDALFLHADAPGEPPAGAKQAKVQAWLHTVNKQAGEPLDVLGRLIEKYLDDPDLAANARPIPMFGAPAQLKEKRDFCRKLEVLLNQNGWTYHHSGRISDGSLAPSRSLRDEIAKRDIPAVAQEFDRAIGNVQHNPREALSAACNILESVFKVYLQDNGHALPAKQDIQGLFKEVKLHLGLDPSVLEDEDLKKILSGVFSVVDGVGAFRTHASSAHGAGRKSYRLEPRHARVAINAAHTVALFVLETWTARTGQTA
ncbi:MAG: abortive infection family protein [Luteibacter sp.]|uniref:abortive infection family protein n=1 Tax=Luteibacter sp. TaxID=1886636 RepID=UPI0028071B8E|nr:abortive infection family protein [Luteibacter sp.]MDQ7995206.1 abortive infection family protein [Luteibacter sp.]